MKIAAFDPGATIGICIFNGSDKYEQRQLVPSEYPHPHETIYDVLSEIKPSVIVYERFDFRAAKNGAVLIGVEYIGVIELYAQMNCIEVTKISPSDGKAFWNDNKLRAAQIYQRGIPHAMDATRILNTYRMRTDEKFKADMLEILHQHLV